MKPKQLNPRSVVSSRLRSKFLTTLACLGVACSIPLPIASAAPAYALKKVAEGLVSPLVLRSIPDGSGHKVIVDQMGLVHVLSKDGALLEKPFLDLREKLVKLNQGFDERGVLGLAFHPQFRQNKKFYVFYAAPLRSTAPKDWDHTGRLSEFKVSGENPLAADPASERIVLENDHPYFNHNSGRIEFGPDGFLYIGVGDGGNANDDGRGHNPTIGNGQDTTVLLGKMLRIDVDHGAPYGIPKDNPFADGKKGRPEIFAYGLRNPWGFSFDRGGSHELFSADVGQDRMEEINIIVKGGNYGWNIREGTSCFDPKKPTDPPSDCPKVGPSGEPLIDPIVAYKNFKGFAKDPEARGTSVTGGYVYRGKAMPALQGTYVFADWSRSWVKGDAALYTATRPEAGAGHAWKMGWLDIDPAGKGSVGAFVTALGEDAEGELYIMTNASNALAGKNGKVHQLVPAK